MPVSIITKIDEHEYEKMISVPHHMTCTSLHIFHPEIDDDYNSKLGFHGSIAPESFEALFPHHPLLERLRQGRAEDTPVKPSSRSSSSSSSSASSSSPQKRMKSQHYRRSTDSEQMDKIWAAVSHQGTVLVELLRECSVPPPLPVLPAVLRPHRAVSTNWPQEDILSIATSEEGPASPKNATADCASARGALRSGLQLLTAEAIIGFAALFKDRSTGQTAALGVCCHRPKEPSGLLALLHRHLGCDCISHIPTKRRCGISGGEKHVAEPDDAELVSLSKRLVENAVLKAVQQYLEETQLNKNRHAGVSPSKTEENLNDAEHRK
ncbi:AKA7G protein, partial [Polyodon spathula]|nr:AKA7G protein [Polyodon spathula]